MSINRRDFSAGAIALFASRSARATDAPIPVKLGWLKSSLSLVLSPIAMDEGFYSKNGLAPQVTEIRSGDGSLGPQSVMASQLDFYIGVISDVAKLNSQAIDAGAKPPLMVFAVGSPGATNLVLRNDIPFSSIQDIKGLRIAVSSLGSAHLVTFRQYLAEQHTSVEALNLQLLSVDGGDMPAALVTGQIDGFLHSQPTPAIAVATGKAKLVLTPAQMGRAGTSPNVGLIARTDWAKAHADVVKRMIAALREASDAYPSLPRQTVTDIAVKYLGGDPAIVAASFDSIDPRLVPDPQKGADTYWSVEMAAMKTRGEVSPDFKQSDMFDFSLAR
jgi:NitT/TauT family transport system substrate-binding protein